MEKQPKERKLLKRNKLLKMRESKRDSKMMRRPKLEDAESLREYIKRSRKRGLS